MEFVARLLKDGLDEAMLLFTLRRTGAQATFHSPPKGGSDIEIRGTVKEDKLDELIKALTGRTGGLHAEERHWRLGDGTEVDSVEEAEAALPGPWTMPGAKRSDWSFGGDDMDRVVQSLAVHGKQDVKSLHEQTGLRVEEVMRALQPLTSGQTVRKYRVPQGPEQYDLAGDVRSKLPV